MARDFDFFNADGSSLLTWAAGHLAPERFFVVLPFGRVQEWLDDFGASSVDDLVGADPRAMVFRQDHVYAAKRQRGTWYTLDSLSPRPFAMDLDRHGKDVGMVVGLVPEAAAKVAWKLESRIMGFLNRFPGTHTQTAKDLLVKDALGTSTATSRTGSKPGFACSGGSGAEEPDPAPSPPRRAGDAGVPQHGQGREPGPACVRNGVFVKKKMVWAFVSLHQP